MYLQIYAERAVAHNFIRLNIRCIEFTERYESRVGHLKYFGLGGG